MIKKTLSITLCISTFLNSFTFAMDADQANTSQAAKVVNQDVSLAHLDETHLAAYHQQHSATQRILTRNIPADLAVRFCQGTRTGLVEYTKDSVDFFRKIYSREFNTLSAETIKSLIQQHFQTNVEHYLSKHTKTREDGEIDQSTLTELFTLMREQTYQALLKTGLFGKPRLVYIPERGVTETHYDVTTSLSTTFLDAIIPNAMPLRGVILGLSNNKHINKFMLRRIDGLFAKMTLTFFEKLTSKKISDLLPTLKHMEFAGLTCTNSLYAAYQLATADYADAEEVSELTRQSQESLSKVWDYLEPRLSHYIRSGIGESLVTLAGFSVDKISEPAFIKLSKIIANNAVGLKSIAAVAAYNIGESFTAVPYLDGAAVSGLVYWLTGALINAGIPKGLEESRKELVKIVNEQLKLQVDCYTHTLIPLSEKEHALFGLNPKPSQEELSLFRKDYELRSVLLSESLVSAALDDLYNTSQSLFASITGYGKFFYKGENNAAARTLLIPCQSLAQTSHKDTVARIKLYKIIAELSKLEILSGEKEPKSLIGRLVSLFAASDTSRKMPLSEEDQKLLEAIQKYPSFAMHKDELELLANTFTWLSKSDREKKLTPYLSSQANLSKEFVEGAKEVVKLLNSATNSLKAYVDNPEEALKILQLELPFEDYVLALRALNTLEVREAFFASGEDLNLLPAFYLEMTEGKDSEEERQQFFKLFSLINNSTFGAGLTLKEKIARARDLISYKDALEQITKATEKLSGHSIVTVGAPSLWQRYERYRDNYLAVVYFNAFMKGIDQNLIIKLAIELNKVKGSESSALLTKLYSEDVTIGKLRETLRNYLSEGARKKFHSLLKGQILAKSEELKAVPLSSTNLGDQKFNLPMLPDLKDLELASIKEDGLEAYVVSEIVGQMLKEDASVFSGRSGVELSQEDIKKVVEKIDNLRLSHVMISEELMLIERHKEELAHFVAHNSPFNQSVVWRYEELINAINKRNTLLIETVKNPPTETVEDSSTETDNDSLSLHSFEFIEDYKGHSDKSSEHGELPASRETSNTTGQD